MPRALFTAAAIAVTAIAVTAIAPRIADACSLPPCRPGYLVPGDAARVPANLPAVTWRPIEDHSGDRYVPDPALVELREIGGGAIPLAPTELEYGDYRLDLDAPLEPGTSYRLADDTVCGDGSEGPRVAFEATAEAPYPEALGRLEVVRENVDDNLLIGTASGSCTTGTVSAVARVELDPAAEAEPWLDALHFETIVDGEPWTATSAITATYPPGESWIGRGRDLLYHVCAATASAEPDPGLAEGRHEVWFRATLPGTDVAVETKPVSVELDCGEDEPSAGARGCAFAGRTRGKGGGAALVTALALVARRRRIR